MENKNSLETHKDNQKSTSFCKHLKTWILWLTRREAGTFCPGAVTTLGQGLRPAEGGDSVSVWNLGGAPDKQGESAGKRYVCAAPVPIALHQPSKNEKKKAIS